MKKIEDFAFGLLTGVIGVGLWLIVSAEPKPAAAIAAAVVSSAPMTRKVMPGGEIGIMPMSRLIDPQTGVVCYTAGDHFACVTIGSKLATELSRLK